MPHASHVSPSPLQNPAVFQDLSHCDPDRSERENLVDVYRTAKNFITKHNIVWLYKILKTDQLNQLTICNLWRVDRLADGTVRTYEFNLNSEVWEEVHTLDGWPDIALYPIVGNGSLIWWRTIIELAIRKALMAAGYQSLVDDEKKILKEYRLERRKALAKNGRPELTDEDMEYEFGEKNSEKMADTLIARYLGRERRQFNLAGRNRNWSKKRTWRVGLLKPFFMMKGARALRAVIFDHVFEKQVVSALLVIDYTSLSLLRYLRYAKHREGLLKVAIEHRNLLPMLPGINPDQWMRPNLFSRKLWVKGDRKSTVVDRPGFSAESIGGVGEYASFDSVSSYRWLTKASSVLVREWARTKDSAVITNIALANVNARVPVLAYQHLMRSTWAGNFRLPVSPAIQRLYRIFLLHCAKIWKEKGFLEVKGWVRANEQSNITSMLDYLREEGFDQGQPEKHATWPSLVRRCDDWHQRIAITNMEREVGGVEMLTWTSLISETTIDNVKLVALDTSQKLAVEGYVMQHCIGQYRDACHRGEYRVFSVTEPDGVRSTIGLRIINGNVLLDQHNGKYNGSISPAAYAAGVKLTGEYYAAIQSGH